MPTRADQSINASAEGSASLAKSGSKTTSETDSSSTTSKAEIVPWVIVGLVITGAIVFILWSSWAASKSKRHHNKSKDPATEFGMASLRIHSVVVNSLPVDAPASRENEVVREILEDSPRPIQ